MDTQEIDQQQAAVDKFFASKPEGCVLVIGDYSPNGGQPQWEYYVPNEQAGCDPVLEKEDGQPVWDTVELNDHNELRFSRTPARSVHRYRSYQWEPAEERTDDLIDAYTGGQGLDWTEIKDFGDWLQSECDLPEGGAGFDACMKAALAKAAELFG